MIFSVILKQEKPPFFTVVAAFARNACTGGVAGVRMEIVLTIIGQEVHMIWLTQMVGMRTVKNL